MLLTKMLLVALLLVDVRPSLPAPEQSKRPRGKFPDPGVVMGVRQSRGFERVLAECRAKLQYNGIVYIGCNKANHRAPTVAAELSRESGCYVVHAGLSNVTAKDIATLTWACFQNRMNQPNYSLDVARYFAEMREPPELTLGWDWRGFEGCQPFQHCRAVIPIMRKGTTLCLLGTLEQHTPVGRPQLPHRRQLPGWLWTLQLVLPHPGPASRRRLDAGRGYGRLQRASPPPKHHRE